jgi:hypothetical protein
MRIVNNTGAKLGIWTFLIGFLILKARPVQFSEYRANIGNPAFGLG